LAHHSDTPPDAARPVPHAGLQGPGRGQDQSQAATHGSEPHLPVDRTERTILDDQAIRRALMRIAHEIVESTEHPDRIYLVAIPNGGVPLGRILADNLESLTGLRAPLGILDTTLYRDDLSTRGSRPKLRRTEMPSSVDDRVVVLVEDVVSTGRTIRAGMDALMDFGRPSHVRVVALVDRGHRELPIKIDFVGKNIPTQPNEKVVFLNNYADDADEADDVVEAEGADGRNAFKASGDLDRAEATNASAPGILQLIVRSGGGA
jgi:pyrimidine operon attenuation protein/uracil phosphoribosyltransferase